MQDCDSIFSASSGRCDVVWSTWSPSFFFSATVQVAPQLSRAFDIFEMSLQMFAPTLLYGKEKVEFRWWQHGPKKDISKPRTIEAVFLTDLRQGSLLLCVKLSLTHAFIILFASTARAFF